MGDDEPQSRGLFDVREITCRACGKRFEPDADEAKAFIRGFAVDCEECDPA